MQKTVMIVDDVQSMRGLVSITLSNSGYNVIEACDGKDALSKLSGARVNMVISDVNMPNMNGIDFLKSVKADTRSTRLFLKIWWKLDITHIVSVKIAAIIDAV